MRTLGTKGRAALVLASIALPACGERYSEADEAGMLRRMDAARPILDEIRAHCDAHGFPPASLEDVGFEEKGDLHYAVDGSYWQLYFEIYADVLDMSPDVLAYHSDHDYSGMPEGRPLWAWWWCEGY